MRKLLLISSLFFLSAVYAKNETEEAKKSFKALIEPILQKQANDPASTTRDFSVANCEKYKINWMDVIMMQKSIALSYKFKPGCDIEGVIKPMVLKPFPVSLKLKNLSKFNLLESENKITATIESLPIMNLAVRSAKLTGAQGLVKFEADYSVRINPLKENNIIEENLGGEIRITEIYGKVANIKEKIKVE